MTHKQSFTRTKLISHFMLRSPWMRSLIISNEARFRDCNFALALLIYAFINSPIASFLIDGGGR